MEKAVSHLSCGVLASFLCAFGCPIRAQVSNPSAWESFVNGKDNPVVSDTFRLQTFGKSAWDNWEYQPFGEASLLEEEQTLKLPNGSSVTFAPYSLSIYDTVEINTFIRAENLTANDKLFYDVFREGKQENISVPLASLRKDGHQFNYIKKSPSSLTVRTGLSDEPSTCAFLFDSVYATGYIPAYSLFSGSDNWNDTARWSHLPPLRHRNALIQGEATISNDTQCGDIAIYNGSLQLSEGKQLSLHDLTLHGDTAFLRSNGTLSISGSICLHKTFEKLGHWYFISFPFDVYLSGIDSRFQQQDDKFEGTGNYFYLQRYNGEKRSSRNQASGNWEVVSRHTDSQTPLFEKNKGYLIALDAKANDQTLSFSSRPGDIPKDFANQGVLSLPVEASQTSANQDNFGWFLCGNPLPAPLALSQIEKNTSLDGNIYVYDGNTYQRYSINGNPDYALPPFSAFFLKASQTTEVKVRTEAIPTENLRLIRTGTFLHQQASEPEQEGKTHTISPSVNDFRVFLHNRQLYVENMLEPSRLNLFNLSGQCLLTKRIAAGSHRFSLAKYRQGMYIVHIRTADRVIIHKIHLL